MFKKLLVGTLAAMILVAAGANALTAQAAPITAPEGTTVQVVPSTTALTADETAGLLFMYEEEKLAHDVYNALNALWGQTTFSSIAASEQTHMDAINTLLVRYGIATPSAAAGTFSDTSLQSLYSSLMSTGSLSLADALKVGATIEEVDILDLQSRLALTVNADIQLVYNNLMSGSYNHLRNFTSVLTRVTGEVYQPQYLSADLYQTIVTSTNGNGQSYGTSTGTTTTSDRSRLWCGHQHFHQHDHHDRWRPGTSRREVNDPLTDRHNQNNNRLPRSSREAMRFQRTNSQARRLIPAMNTIALTTSSELTRMWTMIERFRLRHCTANTSGSIPSVRVTNIQGVQMW